MIRSSLEDTALALAHTGAAMPPVPVPGPDLDALHELTARVMRDVAAVVIRDAEVRNAPRPTDAYEALFLEAFWAEAPSLFGPCPTRSLVARFEECGALCVEYFVEHLAPRLQGSERLIMHDQPITWAIPTRSRGVIRLASYVARLGEVLGSGTLRLYFWHTEDYPEHDARIDRRPDHVAIALGWLEDLFPGRPVRIVDAFLYSRVVTESSWSQEEIRGARLLFHLLGPGPRESVIGVA